MDNSSYKIKSGFITGLVQTILLYPLDTIHLRYFLNYQETQILYSGLAFTLFGNLIKKSLLFPVQDISSGYAKNKDISYPSMFSAFIGGTLGLCLTPINSIRVPLQLNPINTVGAVCRGIYQYHGILGFYRGGFGIFCRNFIWTFVYFPSFNYLLNLYHSVLLSSITASFLATTLSYPLNSSRLYRQDHLNNYSFRYGIRRAFDPTRSNLTSFLVGNLRISLSACFTHCVYLMVSSSSKLKH